MHQIKTNHTYNCGELTLTGCQVHTKLLYYSLNPSSQLDLESKMMMKDSWVEIRTGTDHRMVWIGKDL